MIEIIPSILVKTRQEMLDKIAIVEPYVERVHLDIADGIFVPNLTIGAAEGIEDIETNLKIGVHLMVAKPENHIARWVDSQADKIIFHIEATTKAQEVISTLKEAEMSIGIALNPQTPTTSIEPYIELIDFVHFMTVEPGFYGGKFVDAVVDKISDFHYFYPDMPIEVDGGVTPETAPKLIQAGASLLVVGSFIFDSRDAGKAIEAMKATL